MSVHNLRRWQFVASLRGGGVRSCGRTAARSGIKGKATMLWLVKFLVTIAVMISF